MSQQNAQSPSPGRIVLLKITAEHAEQINQRRQAAGLTNASNTAKEGDTYPLVVVRVWPDEYGPGIPGVNGQAFLDGPDTLWVTSAREGEGLGEWSWPKRS
jgi:hypothetical protein